MVDRLFRSEDDRVIAGVAGGLADLWDADPALIRLLWVLLAIFTGGIALLVYVIMAIVVPDESVVYPGGRPVASNLAAQGSPGETPRPPTRAEARRARRAARRAARNGRDGRPGLAIAGSVLIILGAWFLLREWIPALDFDWVWPAILIATGVLIVAFALDRRSEKPGGAA
ncbi:MAG TPA: PspC domain-containing protein [Candidatus Limnocylindrales bacterium]|nr:PspC domain-containing protein [Candidatus Limnocylindrales bacterium]